jgi:hypothetical protein
LPRRHDTVEHNMNFQSRENLKYCIWECLIVRLFTDQSIAFLRCFAYLWNTRCI